MVRRGRLVTSGDTTSVYGLDKTVLFETYSPWDVTVEGSDAHHALVIKVNGAANNTVRWVASVRTAELTFPD